ncbi:MAG: hypothetical protein QXV35_05900 [Archaeoglobaceae archaeon]
MLKNEIIEINRNWVDKIEKENLIKKYLDFLNKLVGGVRLG